MQGPILRPIQRLGKLGKRSNVPNAEAADPNQTKDPKFVYLSIDECGSHVGNRKTTFFRYATFEPRLLRFCHCLNCQQMESGSVQFQNRPCFNLRTGFLAGLGDFQLLLQTADVISRRTGH